MVYEMESRVRELRRSTEAEPAPTPRETPKQPARDGSGSPSSTVPQEAHLGREPQRNRRMRPAPRRTSWPPVSTAQEEQQIYQREVFRALRSTTEDQAERSLV